MSIEAMKLAIEALEDTKKLEHLQDYGLRQEAIDALRAAIQQAEAQQPATGEPVVSRNPFASRCYTMSESHLSGHRLIVGFEKLEDTQDAHEWVARQVRGDFTHPAPSVPTAWAKDLFLVVHAMEMNNWHWKSTASNDLKRDAHAAATRLYAATLAAKEGGAA